MKFLAALALPLFALDQATKWWVIKHLEFGAQRTVILGFFDLVHARNTGAAFSMFAGNNVFFIVLSLATLAGLLVAVAKGVFADEWSRWGVGLLCAGILGNVTDRLIHGYVVDFLLFDLHVKYADPFAVFNIADSCICIAVACFLVATLRESRAARTAS